MVRMYVSKQNSPEIIGDTGRTYVVGFGQNPLNVFTTDHIAHYEENNQSCALVARWN